MEIVYKPIGVIHTPFHEIEGMPIQPSGASGIKGTVEIFPEYLEGLKDLDGFSHILLLYHFHRVKIEKLIVTPFLDSRPHGIFSTRAPKRPNPIGISVVRLIKIDKNILSIENVDILNGTPLLDIKPLIPEFDHHHVTSIGWFEKAKGRVKHTRSDDRFK